MAEEDAIHDATEDEDAGVESVFNFIGPCTCDHGVGQHGFMGCEVDGCDCIGGWES